MDLETKVLSQRIAAALYNTGETLGTAESCTGGRIAESIIGTPGASQYFKGGIVSYTNEIKEKLLNVSSEVLAEQTAVCEEVAREMVVGACATLGVDYAISATGVAGPTGGTPGIPVGTIWIGYGSKDDVRTFQIAEDNGRDLNLVFATNKALQLFIDFIAEKHDVSEKE